MSRKSYSSLLQTVTLIIGLKMAQQRPLFCFFRYFQTNIDTILTTNKCEKRHVHPVYRTGIRTHDLWNMTLLPLPLDQGSRLLIIGLKFYLWVYSINH